MASSLPNAPNTVRVVIPPGKRASVGLHMVQKKIFEELLAMERDTIFCLQSFPTAGFFDVTFFQVFHLQTCMARIQEKRGDPLLDGITFLTNEARLRIPLIIQMYNPFVTDMEICTFLSRYCEVASYGTKLTNVFGTFNGQRRFYVKLKPDKDGIGGVVHPPQLFSIGSNRGILFYPGQPQFCRNCFSFGHVKEECTAGQVCRNCFQSGHSTADCPKGKSCHLCGKGDHLARGCPAVGRRRTVLMDGAREEQDGSADVVHSLVPVEPAEKRTFAEVVEGSPSTKVAKTVDVETTHDPCPDDQQFLSDEASDDEGIPPAQVEVPPESLEAEGVKETGADSQGPGESEMDTCRDSLKRKMLESGGSALSVCVEDPISGSSTAGLESALESDSSEQSFISNTQVDVLENVMGFQKKTKKKEKAKIEPRMTGVLQAEEPGSSKKSRGRARSSRS